MTERERLIDQLEEAFLQELKEIGCNYYSVGSLPYHKLAIAALKVIERKQSSVDEVYTHICTCEQNGYHPNNPLSNHPHRKDCPQYDH